MATAEPPYLRRCAAIRRHRRSEKVLVVLACVLGTAAALFLLMPIEMLSGDSRWVDQRQVTVALAHANRALSFRIGAAAAALAALALTLRSVLVARWRRQGEW